MQRAQTQLGNEVKSLYMGVLTLLLTEVTLRALGAGDLRVTGITPLLRLLFGVPGPDSGLMGSDKPVLPLNDKTHSFRLYYGSRAAAKNTGRGNIEK
jgi:hypothetical protein